MFHSELISVQDWVNNCINNYYVLDCINNYYVYSLVIILIIIVLILALIINEIHYFHINNISASGNPGDNVTVPIPLVDRGRGDPRNVMGVIIDRDENDMYRIAVRAGMLKGKYSRNQFDLCVQKLLQESDISRNEELPLRTAVQLESRCGGQGFLKCNCSGAGKCQSNRCRCFKAKVKCNSRCHASLSCENKT
jgi:hypothetical protein